MIYLDNGATSFPKPRGMVAAMEECIMRYCGNPGRSGHEMSLQTGKAVFQARQTLAELFHIRDGERLVRRKRMIMAPGEMETIQIDLNKLAGAETITLKLED